MFATVLTFLGGLWGTITAALKLSNTVATEAHDATERKAGSDATTAATQQATIASVERQNQAAVNAPGVEGTIAALDKEQF